MLRRTPFKRPVYTPAPLAPLKPATRLGVYADCGEMAKPVAKSVPRRNARLLTLAKDMPCLLMVPGCCNHRVDTTVACHSNLSIHGKAGARKADDQYSVWGCMACHSWLDTGPASAAQKERAFMVAHLLQVLAWRSIAADPQRSESDRRAARWALDLLDATPLTDQLKETS